MRTICLYSLRTSRSNSACWARSIDFADIAMYSSATPATVSIEAMPRMSSDFAPPGESPLSMASATFGRDDSAATFGEVVAVQTMMRSPFQRKPTGIARG